MDVVGWGGVNVPALTHWPPPVAPFDQEDHFVVEGPLALAVSVSV